MFSQREVGIVGAGPAGIMAALEAAGRGARVTLFDTNPMVGRKILVTGNGRCNISNLHATADRYDCADRAFMEQALSLCGSKQMLERLYDLAIPTYATADDWCYPLSDSAAAVRDALEAALEVAGVDVRLQTKIADIRRMSGGFVLEVGGGPHTITVDRVIVASGGKAYPALGSRGELFPAIARMGHTIVPIYPALVPITADMRPFHKLQGVRLDVGLTLLEGDRVLGQTVGNLMFTQSGFSGPAAMDLSYLVSTRLSARLTLSIDLLPRYRDDLLSLLSRMQHKPIPVAVLLASVLPPKIPPVILPLVGLTPDARLSDVSVADVERLLDRLTNLPARVTGTRGFQFAQVSTGGVPVTEVDPRTMASRIVPGLHFAGEVMDVVGPCGGYNLQWAWMSGAIAGAAAGHGSA